MPWFKQHNASDHVPDQAQWISALFEQYYPVLCLLANRIVNDQQAAEDIVQDCFTKLWQNRKALQHITNHIAYVYTAVRNHALNYKRDRQPTNDIDIIDVHDEDNMLRDIIAVETIYQLYQALQTLPPKCRRVFELYYVQGKDHDEIARTMSITSSTVRNQKAKGIVLLRKKLRALF